MSARKLSLAAWLLVAVLAVGDRANGQGREPVRPPTIGMVKSVEAGKITISQPGQGREAPPIDKSFDLAKNVEVAIGAGFGGGGRFGGGLFKEGKLADLSAGIRVTLMLSTDQKMVEGIIADTPVVRGQLSGVDAKKNTITIKTQTGGREAPVSEEATYKVAAGAEIAVDDGRGRRFSMREAKLGDLVQGGTVTAWLSLDKKEVHSLIAEGPNFQGVVKEIDPTKRTITLTIRPARGDDAAEEKNVNVPKDAIVVIDDGRGKLLSVKQGKLADIPVGAMINGKMSMDQVSVTLIRAEGPNLFGMLKGVDAEKGIITIGIPKSRTEFDEKSFSVAKDARITLDGNAAKLSELKVGDNGPFVQVRLTLDQKTAQIVMVRQPGSR